MDMRKDMEKDFITLLSRLIIEKDDDTPNRLTAQTDALKERECINPELGKWIDSSDFPFLIETLMLDATIFSREFPRVHMPVDERKAFAGTLELHCESCPRCHLKRAYDIEWQSRIKKALAENKRAIGQALGHAASGK
jgi:hypothetical protein